MGKQREAEVHLSKEMPIAQVWEQIVLTGQYRLLLAEGVRWPEGEPAGAQRIREAKKGDREV